MLIFSLKDKFLLKNWQIKTWFLTRGEGGKPVSDFFLIRGEGGRLISDFGWQGGEGCLDPSIFCMWTAPIYTYIVFSFFSLNSRYCWAWLNVQQKEIVSSHFFFSHLQAFKFGTIMSDPTVFEYRIQTHYNLNKKYNKNVALLFSFNPN